MQMEWGCCNNSKMADYQVLLKLMKPREVQRFKFII